MAKTIGVIVDQLVYEYQAEFWHGVCHQAQESKANLVSFVGSTIDTSNIALINMNKVYHFLSSRRIDGVIILISSVASRIDKNAKSSFVKGIASRFPTVCVGDIFNEYPSIGVDNRKGMYDSVNHLIVQHGKKRVAFIGGPTASDEATVRFQAYKDALKDNKIPFDENLFYPGHFVFDSGVEAIRTFVEKKITFDAVVAASDWMAFGAMQELWQRGFNIPGQIAVSGFDNVESADISNPPMSSVKQPVYEMGCQAIKTIINIIDKRDYDKCTIFPTEHIIRNSCGCLLVEKSSDIEYRTQSASLSLEMRNELKQELIKKLRDDIGKPGSMEFLHLFNGSLKHVTRTKDVNDFHNIIAEIRQVLVTPDSAISTSDAPVEKIKTRGKIKRKDAEVLFSSLCKFVHTIEDNLHKAHGLVTRRAEQLQFIKYLNANNKSSQIINIGQRLLTSYSRDFLFSVISHDFPTVDINSCAILEYVDPLANPISKLSKPIFHFSKDKEIVYAGDAFETTHIIPDALWPPESSSPWIANIISINYKNTPMGYVFYESANQFGLVFETLSSEIASALKGIEIYEEHKKISISIEERSKKINALVAPMLESILQVASLSGKEIETIKTLSSITSAGLLQLQSANEKIEKASQSINQMFDMTSLIQDLSDNINILALNASIESARAGKYGLGFQVIATEVKHLSDSTAQNTKNISDALSKVVKNIEESNIASKENYKVFTNVKNHVEQVTNLLNNVTNKMNELSAASNNILAEIERKI